ncbi:MAG: TonB-dependent receptor domain-containing protein [Bryobacteraceae bacterium]
MRHAAAILSFAVLPAGAPCWAQSSASAPPPAARAKPAANNPPSGSDPQAPAVELRTRLNLLGQTDSYSGESRRNENVQFNLIDNNLLRELNTRLGTTATLILEFSPERTYYGAEYGNSPGSPIHLATPLRRPWHGRWFESHLNSVFSARSFFQVGDVKPARENSYGAELSGPLARRTAFSLSGSQQKIRGMVNGNVLVPLASERTPLAADPALAAYVRRILSAYPDELPNRTDINPRMLNTNAPQRINSDTAAFRLDHSASERNRLALRHQVILQRVLAFQLVNGQNPDTATRSHQSRLTWTHQRGPSFQLHASLGFDRSGSQLVPENNNIGPRIATGGLSTVGPHQDLPIDRVERLYRHSLLARLRRGTHELSSGYELARRHVHGIQNDSVLASISFQNDAGRDAITNLRLGLPTRMFVSIGDTYRRFRSWDLTFFLGDKWQLSPALTLTFALRYQPLPAPTEASRLTTFPYDCDCNNFAPSAGFAWRLGRNLGVFRAAYGLAYDTISHATYQQLRFNPPGNRKLVITNPDLQDPVGTYLRSPAQEQRASLYLLDANLAVPYSHQYNASWEPPDLGPLRLQLGYVGSRTPKIIQMWYLNRARVVPGVPLTTATVDERRPDPRLSEVKLMLNGSFAWYDAARLTLILPRWRGLSAEASYWFSKALDLGANYSDTASNRTQNRGQFEFDSHHDLKALSDFDQPHAFLARVAYDLPGAGAPVGRWRSVASGWRLAGVILLKTGTPFLVESGSDSPGFGNVDGALGDRPHLLVPSILGRTIGNPDSSCSLLPRSAFSYIRPGELAGTLGRNVFRKGPIYNVNAMISRSFPLRGDWAIQLRGESINLFNTPQFAAPGSSLANPDFGMITNTLNDGRTLRFQLSLEF